MSITYKAGIAFGVYISADDLSEALDKIAEQKIKNFYAEGHTTADYEELFAFGKFDTAKEIAKEELYDDEILINLDYYCDSAGYILGYKLDSVECGAKPLETKLPMDTAPLMEKKIAEWYQKLFPGKEIPASQLLLYSQLA